MLKVLGIYGSYCNRLILKSQWFNTERFISHHITGCYWLVALLQVVTQELRLLSSCNYTISESFTLPAWRGEGGGLPWTERAISLPLAFPLARM